MANRSGFSMVELLVTTVLFAFMTGAVFGLLGAANGNFFNADTSIDVRNTLRVASDKILSEVRNTGYQAGAPQFTISAAVSGSNSIQFSVPVVCSSSGFVLNSSGNPAYWGAPLTWGCTTSSCMDANNSCSTLEYKFIRYSRNGSNAILREVLDASSNVVATTTIARNITALLFTLSQDGKMITVSMTGQQTSSVNKVITESFTNKVLLTNADG